MYWAEQAVSQELVIIGSTELLTNSGAGQIVQSLTNTAARSNRSSRSIALLRSSRGPVRSKRSKCSTASLRSNRLTLLGPERELSRFGNSRNVEMSAYLSIKERLRDRLK